MKSLIQLSKHLFLSTVLLGLLACSGRSPSEEMPSRSLESIKADGVVRVVTRNAPTTYYIGRDGEATGPEFEMAQAYADHMNLKLEIVQKDSIQDILMALKNGEADFAAAGLTVIDERESDFQFGYAYQDISQQVVCRRDHVQPESVEELIGLNILVVAESSYEQRLQDLKETFPSLAWQATSELSTEEILIKLFDKEIDCTVADSNIVDINRRYFPELITPFNLSESQSLAWMMPKGQKDLHKSINKWFKAYDDSGRLAALKEEYYGFFEVFDYVDTRKFILRIHKRLPKFEPIFREASKKYGIPYELLAAQAYQESHWRPDAKSPTGVRGMMMLTRNTAKAVGVSNRLDPKESIFGGAKYLAKIKDKRFSENVTEPDLTWLSLAAYNIGRAHLHDAQGLARKLGLSPYHWRDMKQVLPLLSEKRYYEKLKYGYARGTEPVRYVQRIREYQHILENELGSAQKQ